MTMRVTAGSKGNVSPLKEEGTGTIVFTVAPGVKVRSYGFMVECALKSN